MTKIERIDEEMDGEDGTERAKKRDFLDGGTRGINMSCGCVNDPHFPKHEPHLVSFHLKCEGP